MCWHSSTTITVCVLIIGGVAVLWSYYEVFKSESSGYLDSRYWMGIPRKTTATILVLQICAAAGFITFFAFVIYNQSSDKGVVTKGILSRRQGHTTWIVLLVFYAVSFCWPFLTKWYLKEMNNVAKWLTAVSLMLAAGCATLMVAGAFEAQMHPMAVLGVIMFATVVIIVDGIGWNAVMIFGHDSNERIAMLG